MIKVEVEVRKCVEVEISVYDAMKALHNDLHDFALRGAYMRLIGAFHLVLTNTEQELINDLSDKQRQIIKDALTHHLKRFE